MITQIFTTHTNNNWPLKLACFVNPKPNRCISAYQPWLKPIDLQRTGSSGLLEKSITQSVSPRVTTSSSGLFFLAL